MGQSLYPLCTIITVTIAFHIKGMPLIHPAGGLGTQSIPSHPTSSEALTDPWVCQSMVLRDHNRTYFLLRKKPVEYGLQGYRCYSDTLTDTAANILHEFSPWLQCLLFKYDRLCVLQRSCWLMINQKIISSGSNASLDVPLCFWCRAVDQQNVFWCVMS